MKSPNFAQNPENQTELFPEITKKVPKANPSSSGVIRIDTILETGRQWYQQNIQINDSRDTLPDIEDMDAIVNQALIDADKNRSNRHFLHSAFLEMLKIIKPAISIIRNPNLSAIEKVQYLRNIQGEVNAYLDSLSESKYRKLISYHIIQECQTEINTLEWTDLKSLTKGVETLEKHFSNKVFLQNTLEEMVEIMQPATDIYFDTTLSEKEKLDYLEKTRGDVITYLNNLYGDKYDKYISPAIIRDCLTEIQAEKWIDIESLVKGVETLEKHFHWGY